MHTELTSTSVRQLLEIEPFDCNWDNLHSDSLSELSRVRNEPRQLFKCKLHPQTPGWPDQKSHSAQGKGEALVPLFSPFFYLLCFLV